MSGNSGKNLSQVKIFIGPRTLTPFLVGLMIMSTRVDAQKPLILSVAGPASRDVITGTLTYRIKVTNPSASPVLDVRVTDTLPATTEFMSATNAYAGAARIADQTEQLWFSTSTGSTVRTRRI